MFMARHSYSRILSDTCLPKSYKNLFSLQSRGRGVPSPTPTSSSTKEHVTILIEARHNFRRKWSNDAILPAWFLTTCRDKKIREYFTAPRSLRASQIRKWCRSQLFDADPVRSANKRDEFDFSFSRPPSYSDPPDLQKIIDRPNSRLYSAKMHIFIRTYIITTDTSFRWKANV